MKILITGANGCIGQKVVQQLKGFYEIVTLDLNKVQDTDTINYEGLISDKLENILSIHIIDFVIHLAAYTLVGESEDMPCEYYTNNAVETLFLLMMMRKYDIKNIIFSSTSAVYKSSGRALCENDELEYNSVYGNSKIMCEIMIKDICKRYDMNYIIFRFANVCGSRDSEKPCHLLPILISRILEKSKTFCIFGNDYNTEDGTCMRDYVHVVDIAEAFQKAVEYIKNNNVREVINLGSGKSFSTLDIVQTCCLFLEHQMEIRFKDRRIGDAEYVEYDISKAKKLLVWEPKKNLKDMILDTYKDYQN
jgi:UDP-glucose 4-epimerase